MNWKDIQTKYPKAWGAFVFWLMSQEDKYRHYGSFEKVHVDKDTGQLQVPTYNGYSAFTTIIYEPRNLFSFFDEQRFYLWIDYDYETSGQWCACIAVSEIGNGKLVWSEYGDEREERESAAFMKAFELMEATL